MDIQLSGQEVITVDLDDLDSSPDDLLDLLKDSQSEVWVWTRLAGEYWRKGNLDAAEKLVEGGIERTSTNLHVCDPSDFLCIVFRHGTSQVQMPPLYCLLANIQLARARTAPKLILKTPRASFTTYLPFRNRLHL